MSKPGRRCRDVKGKVCCSGVRFVQMANSALRVLRIWDGSVCESVPMPGGGG